MAQDKPSFLKDGQSTSAKPDLLKDLPQKMGGNDKPDGGGDLMKNRPQPMKDNDPNPKSIPSGGKFPYKGAPADTPKPYKLGK